MSRIRRRIMMAANAIADDWWPDTINCRYEIPDGGATVTLLASSSASRYIKKTWIDDEEYDYPVTSYTFTKGNHWVHHELIGDEIGGSLFWCGTSYIKTIELPSSITKIKDYAFRQTAGITELVFRMKVPPTEISGNAWYGNYSLNTGLTTSKVYTMGDIEDWNLYFVGKGSPGGSSGSMKFTSIENYTRRLT